MNNPIRLAIVDDHDMVRQTWKMVLQRNEHIDVIAECSSGIQAIQCAENDNPDVMLMDINMTPVNGFEATKKIAEAFPTVKIIGTSINNQPSYARNMLQNGARGYVTKNSPSNEMIEAIITVNKGGIYVCKEILDKLDGKSLI